MSKEKHVGVILSGSGFLDGAEIQEATLTLLFLDRRGAKVTAMAPNVSQMHVVDHVKGQPASGENRNVLAEAARITRGAIADVKTVKASDSSTHSSFPAATARRRTSAPSPPRG